MLAGSKQALVMLIISSRTVQKIHHICTWLFGPDHKSGQLCSCKLIRAVPSENKLELVAEGNYTQSVPLTCCMSFGDLFSDSAIT